jgi:hypothetical protein
MCFSEKSHVEECCKMTCVSSGEKMCTKCFLVIGILQFQLEQLNIHFDDQFLLMERIQSAVGLSEMACSTGSGPCWIPDLV